MRLHVEDVLEVLIADGVVVIEAAIEERVTKNNPKHAMLIVSIAPRNEALRAIEMRYEHKAHLNTRMPFRMAVFFSGWG